MERFKLTMAMACRNLLRNRRRTISTLLAIAVGLVGLTFLDGYMTYSIHGLGETVVHSGTGHIQAALSPAYFNEGDGDPIPFLLPQAKELERELRELPEVKAVVPTISFIAVMRAKGPSQGEPRGAEHSAGAGPRAGRARADTRRARAREEARP
jgi:ABC-type lipoprotein release transport system permease subunit